MKGAHSALYARSSGFTLLELMVAMFIGLFLVGGMMILVQDNKRTSNTQTQMAKLQDDERLALTMLTNVIQQAGYFPDPTTNTAASMFTTTGPVFGGGFYANNLGFLTPGQALFGYNITNPINVLATSDSLDVRFVTASGDGILNCFGASNTSGSNYNNANFFFTFDGMLWCEDEVPTAIPVVGDPDYSNTANPINVTQLAILYGVNTTGTSNSADTYKTVSQMSSSDWPNVIAVQVTVTFTNPLYSASNPGEPPTVSVSRVIGIMNKIGI